MQISIPPARPPGWERRGRWGPEQHCACPALRGCCWLHHSSARDLRQPGPGWDAVSLSSPNPRGLHTAAGQNRLPVARAGQGTGQRGEKTQQNMAVVPAPFPPKGASPLWSPAPCRRAASTGTCTPGRARRRCMRPGTAPQRRREPVADGAMPAQLSSSSSTAPGSHGSGCWVLIAPAEPFPPQPATPALGSPAPLGSRGAPQPAPPRAALGEQSPAQPRRGCPGAGLAPAGRRLRSSAPRVKAWRELCVPVPGGSVGPAPVWGPAKPPQSS